MDKSTKFATKAKIIHREKTIYPQIIHRLWIKFRFVYNILFHNLKMQEKILDLSGFCEYNINCYLESSNVLVIKGGVIYENDSPAEKEV